MKLRLPLNRPIGTGLVSQAVGLTREAAEQLAGAAADPVESVHRARVALKRARSVLRLLEKAGAAWAIMPRYRLAELGGRMSAAREAAVAAGLAERFSRRLPGRERAVARLLIAPVKPLPALEVEHLRAALFLEASQLANAPAPEVPPGLAVARRRLIARWEAQRELATLTAMHRWLRLETRLTRLLAEENRPRRTARPPQQP